ncbi:hypothetical protein ACFQZZ_20435 [Nocardia sp. GCM10030253]|uniref:hypothetical protein n=1 Tax=Nocardia sp. GCM10030253 TaxID=3273404 RepID=UPI003641F062
MTTLELDVAHLAAGGKPGTAPVVPSTAPGSSWAGEPLGGPSWWELFPERTPLRLR